MNIKHKFNLYVFLTFSFFGFLFWHFSKEMLQVKPEGWYVGQVNLYGDLVYHLSLINKFLFSNKIIIDNPIYANDKVNYPIFADLITSAIARFSGVDFALFITTFVMGILTIAIARLLIKNFIRNEKTVFYSLLLFFLNGGFGFYHFFKDYSISQKSIVDFLLSMPREYTDLKDLGYWWINSYLAYFLPQRAFLFAFPITLIILLLLYFGHKSTKTIHFILAGFLAGTLPLVQAHSLLLLFLLCIFYMPLSLSFSQNKKQQILNWLVFSSLTATLALPLLNVISSVDSPLSYIRFAPGWTSKENIIWFWFKNLGLFGPTLVISIAWLYKQRSLFVLYLPFIFIFIISNILVFQPWEFDNSKLLIYWYFASCIVVGNFIHNIFLDKNFYLKVVGILIIFVMIFSGSLDIFRTFTPVTSYQIYSRTDLEVAKQVELLTPKNAVFVTASNHNNPIPTLTGRSTLIGFNGWLWSHGIKYSQRAKDIEQIYLGGPTAEELIKKYRVNYITVGPIEKSDYSTNLSYFQKYPQINLANGWYIYDVSNLWSNGNRQNGLSH